MTVDNDLGGGGDALTPPSSLREPSSHSLSAWRTTSSRTGLVMKKSMPLLRHSSLSSLAACAAGRPRSVSESPMSADLSTSRSKHQPIRAQKGSGNGA